MLINANIYIFQTTAGSPVHEGSPARSHSGPEELQGDITSGSPADQRDDALLEEIRQGGKGAQEEGGEGGSGAAQTG